MKRALAAVRLTVAAAVCLALVLWSTACVSAQRRAADALARATNAVTPALVELEHREALAAIDAAPATSEAMHAADAAVHARWAPLWEALHVLAVAHGAWVAALDAGEEGGAWAAVLAASCRLAGLVPTLAPSVSLPALGVCP